VKTALTEVKRLKKEKNDEKMDITARLFGPFELSYRVRGRFSHPARGG
jgi:hypothetical protein